MLQFNMNTPRRNSAPLLRPTAKAQAVAPATGSGAAAEPRPPKAPPPRKASCAAECQRLEQLPNIGPSIAADLRALGVVVPQTLVNEDPLLLYQRLCAVRGVRQDPCVLDTFMAAVDFMRGAPERPWWTYTQQRKALYGAV
jgi:Pathogenicity locus